MGIAPSSSSALSGCKGLVPAHIRHQAACLLIVQQGPPGDPDNKIGGGLSRAAVGPALLPVFRHVFALVAEVGQRVDPIVGNKHHAAAPSAVPAVGAAGRHIFFPMEGDGAVASVTRLDLDHGGIAEHKRRPPLLS